MIGPHMLRKGGGGKGRGQDRKTRHYYSGRPRERIRFCECEMVQNNRNGLTLVFIGVSEHRMTSGNKVKEWVKNLPIVRTFGFKNNNKQRIAAVQGEHIDNSSDIVTLLALDARVKLEGRVPSQP